MSASNDQNMATNVSYRTPPNRIVIEKFKECTFHENEHYSYRGVVQTINGQLYVGLSKFWLTKDGRKWLPTKKHFYMPPETWKKFAQITHALTESCNAAAKTMTNLAPSTINGMSPP